MRYIFMSHKKLIFGYICADIMRKTLLLFIYLWASFYTYAQNKAVLDSLHLAYQHAQADTTKISILLELAYKYRFNQADTTIALGKEALLQSEKIAFHQGISMAWNTIGVGYEKKAQYALALNCYEKAISSLEKTKNQQAISAVFNNIAIAYEHQANYPKALEYLQKSLAFKEYTNDINGYGGSLGNMGIIYSKQGNYNKSLEYHKKSLEVFEKTGNQEGIASALGNIGVTYYYLDKLPDALLYYQKSLEMQEKLGNKMSMASCLNNIGEVYYNQEDFPKAQIYLQRSLEIHEQIGDEKGAIYPLTCLAISYQKQKVYQKSIEYAQKAYKIAKKINSLNELKDAANTLYESYKLNGDYAKALEYHEAYKRTNDTIYNKDKAKAFAKLESKAEIAQKEKEIIILSKDRELQRIEIERRKSAQLAQEKQTEANELFAMARQEKDKRKADSLQNLAEKKQLEVEKHLAIEQKLVAQSKQKTTEILKEKKEKEFQQYIIIFIFLGLTSTIIFAYFIFRSRQKEKQAKEDVLEQKEQVQQTNEELAITLEVIQVQKNEIEYKNQAITDSIHYAKRIQTAILPTEEYMQRLLPEHFVLYKPKDIVSGDFYYIQAIDHKIVIAAVDCTGHGVPGALMSMIGNEILSEIVQQKKIATANQILDELDKSIRIALKQQTSEAQDGMDIALVIIDKAQKTLNYAGAKNPLYIFQNKTFTEIQADILAIGGAQTAAQKTFTQHVIPYESPTTFYLFSDGFQDQFGGSRNKKFLVKQFKALLTNIHTQSVTQQKEVLDNALSTWQGNNEQTDDILVIGIRI